MKSATFLNLLSTLLVMIGFARSASAGQGMTSSTQAGRMECLSGLVRGSYGFYLPEGLDYRGKGGADTSFFLAPGPHKEVGIYRHVGGTYLFYSVPADGGKKDEYGYSRMWLTLFGHFSSSEIVPTQYVSLWKSKNFNPNEDGYPGLVVLYTGESAIEELENSGARSGVSEIHGKPISLEAQVIDESTFNRAFNVFVKNAAIFFQNRIEVEILFRNDLVALLLGASMANLSKEETEAVVKSSIENEKAVDSDPEARRRSLRREREKIRKLNELVESFSHRLKMCLISASASLEPESVSVIDGALEAIAKGFEKELPNSGDEQEKNGFFYDRHRGNFR